MNTVPLPTSPPARRPWYHTVARFAGRSVLALCALVVGLAALGATYEALMAAGDARRFPPPGRLVDVGGRQMHIRCVGTGELTVVFESGHSGTSLDWSLVQPQLAGEARVCAYDRAGSGWSEPGPLPRTPERVVEDLHALLRAAGEPKPYVLVGHSLGGRYVRLFAERYPEEVAGMVLVDARGEYHDQALAPEARAALEAQNRPGPTLDWLRRLGVMRLFGAQLYAGQLPGFALLPEEVQRAWAVLGSRPATQEATYSELSERLGSDAVLEAATLGRRPLRVLASKQVIAMEPTWLPGQERHAALSSDAALRTLPGGHYLQLEQADAVSGAVREVLDTLRP